jgi:hypothetical protein
MAAFWGGLELQVGSESLRFVEIDGAPFYHFALLVPRDRFEAAASWLSELSPLLTKPGETWTTFDFTFWDALASYAHDPAGNIVEVIAHHGVGESGRTGPFSPDELLGISEIGLVATELQRAVADLDAAGLPLWSGQLDGDHGLGFAGGKAHTLILCAPGRGWLPTGRAAEPWPVRARMRNEAGSSVEVRADGRIAVAAA